jgi:hypothetical protein
MSAHDALGYRGEMPPESLPGEVVFRPHFWLCLHLGFAGAVFGYMVLAAGVAAYLLVVDPLRPLDHALVAAVPVVFGIVVAVRMWRGVRGLEVTVGPERITVARDGVIVQDCTWDQTTLVRKPGTNRYALADQFGQVIPISGVMQTKPPGDRLVFLAIRTRERQLATPRDAIPPGVRRRWWLLGAAAVAATATGLALLLPASERFQELVANPGAGATDRAGALMLLILCGLLVALAMLTLPVFLLPLQNWADQKMRVKHSELTEFIAERKGVLRAADMKPRVRYRYIAPDQVRANDHGLIGGWLFLGLALFIGIICGIALWHTPPQERLWPAVGVSAFVGLFAVSGWMFFRKSRLLRRGVDCEFLLTGSGDIEVHRGGEACVYHLARKSKAQHHVHTHLGQVWWLLRAEDGRQILVDPRYLIPAEESGCLTSRRPM